jgi:tetratricopeptide (TPR) repeat protein
MRMHPSLLLVLVGVLYILGFGALSVVRRQGLSDRFIFEGLIITAAGAAIAVTPIPLHPVVFLLFLYLITMRVRLLVDLGNLFTSRHRCEQALSLFRLALRLWPDPVSRQIVLINRGVTQLRMQEPEAAYVTLKTALANEQVRQGAKYLAAGYYNLGLASRRTGKEAEAVRHFNEAIDTLPSSIYAHGARQALKKKGQSGERQAAAEEGESQDQ